MKKFTFMLTLLIAFAGFTLGQVTTGNLTGVVTDQNGSVVPGANVKLTNVETGQVRETVTNGAGIYNFVSLLPGEKYQLVVAAKGFSQNTIDNVIIHIGTQNSANIPLSIESAGATVTITGDPALITTDQSQLSTAYTARQLTELPINGGAIETFALLTPGVVSPGSAGLSNGVGISANGNRGRSNNFQVDGQDNNDNSVAGPSLNITNVEAIGEVQVITNVFSAEFGRNSGAQVNAVTKSGTNQFHGSLFGYENNSAFNTSSNLDKKQHQELGFLSANGTPELSGLATRNKDPFGNARFGASLGGPIVKDKLFFFGTYQGDYTRGETFFSGIGSGNFTFTPQSAALIASLLPNAATAALTSTAVAGGPTTAQGVGRAFVTSPTIDTNGDGIADDFAVGPGEFNQSLFVCTVATRPCPAANLVPLETGETSRLVPNRSSLNQVIGRVDYNPTDHDTVGVRYIFDTSKFPLAAGRFAAGAIFDVPSQNNNLGVTYTRAFSSRFTNEARFNFSRLDVKFGDPNAALPGPSVQFSGQRDLAGNFSSLTFGTQNNLPQTRKVDVYQIQDTLISTFGNHNLKFGGDIRFQRVDNFFLPNFLGVYNFAGGNPNLATANATSGQIPTGTPFVFGPGTIINQVDVSQTDRAGFRATAFENFLLARPQRITFALGDPRSRTTQNDYFFFVQDDWKARPNLTLNLGLRYEISTTPFNPIIDDVNARESNSATAIFDTSFPLADRSATRLPLDKDNWAPRVGFAWSPKIPFLKSFFDNKQTVFRGGFGISYDPGFFNIVSNTITAAPFAAAGTVTQTPGAPGSVSFPFLPSTTAELNLTPGTNGGDPRLFNQTRVDPNFYGPYSIGWNFGIQQELSKKSVLEVRYVGTHIVGQFQTLNGNPSVQFLNRGAFCLGQDSGAFSNGNVVGSAPVGTTVTASSDPAHPVGQTILTAAQVACGASNPNITGVTISPIVSRGFSNSPGTNGDGRLDPNFGNVRIRTNGASGTYNGLQVRFDQRLSNLITLNANYTMSKTIDNASEIFSTGGGGQDVADPQQFFNSTSGERGLSAFHQAHSFVANFVGELPYYRDQKGLAGKLLGGYQLSGIIRIGSGRPYTPTELFGTYDPNFENGFIGLGSLRPFQGNPNAPEGTIAFGSTACGVLFGDSGCNSAAAGNFVIYNTLNPGSVGTVVADGAAAAQGARLVYNDFGLANQFGVDAQSLEAFNFFKTPFGNVGRNTLFGNALYSVDLALFKTTRINERFKVEFRVEAQNVLNNRNFGVPDTLTEDAATNFAVSSFQNPGFNAGSVRSLRLGVRLLF